MSIYSLPLERDLIMILYDRGESPAAIASLQRAGAMALLSRAR